MGIVLIVDDEELNIDLLEQEVEELGHDVLTASNGVEALSVLDQNACDLVLLDIMMPEMDGFGVLEELRRRDLLGRLPVIVISALDGMQHITRCVEAGAEDFLLKPFDPVLLEARIKGALHKKSLQDQLANQLEVTRSIFGQYVSEEIASAILRSQGSLVPTETEATVLYCDIENFTSFVERSSHRDVLDTLSAYYSQIVDIVSEHQGTVSQFIGDAIMITFNVPVAIESHATDAIEAARQISTRVREQNFNGTKLKNRIGIATGDVIAGNIHARERLHYSVFGDAVNLAARLEALNKQYGTRILISGRTAELANAPDDLEFVDAIIARGQSSEVQVYSVA